MAQPGPLFICAYIDILNVDVLNSAEIWIVAFIPLVSSRSQIGLSCLYLTDLISIRGTVII